LQDQSAQPPVPADLPRGERGRGRGNAIRPGWCGPQAQPRTRPGLIELPEGEGATLPLTARGVWLVQIPLAHKTEAAGPSAPPPCCGHSILKTEFTVLGLNCHSRYRRQWPQPAQLSHSRKAQRRGCCEREGLPQSRPSSLLSCPRRCCIRLQGQRSADSDLCNVVVLTSRAEVTRCTRTRGSRRSPRLQPSNTVRRQ
jgi:hypothetical protein